MPTPVIMPKLEMSQETAILREWLVAEGERVEKGAPLFVVETDKVTVDVEAPATGVLSGVSARPGDEVRVTTVIAVLLAPDELPMTASRRVSPVAQRVAAAAGVDVAVVPSAEPAYVRRSDVEAYLAQAGAAPRPRATPAARRLAREQGLDLAELVGTGPKGRVQAADVPAAQVRSAPIPTATPLQPEAPPDFDVIPLTGMRRTIAQRMTQSWQTAPHITLTVEVDMSAALVLRDELNAQVQRDGSASISVTALLVKVCAWALKRHPAVNSLLHDDGIHRHHDANIGVAVALDDGLIVPVIAHAGGLGLAAIAARLAELSARARAGQLAPADVSGGTFTISNLGMFGIQQFTAIINPPQAAILAVGRITKRHLVIEGPDGDAAVIRPLLTLTLSADHRLLDGATAARFLQDVVRALERPGVMLL